MTTLAPFPNPILALIALLTPTARTGVEPPSGESWNGSPPYLRLTVIGGGDDRITDSPLVDIDALTDSQQASDALAETVRQILISRPHRIEIESGVFVVIDLAATTQRPHPVPWAASVTVRNTTATYRVSARRSTP